MGTLIWTEDFESYTAGSAVPSPWVSVTNSPVVTAQAHGGTKSLAAGTTGNSSTCQRPLGSNVSQWYADFWMWTNSVGSLTTQFVSFSSTTTTTGIGAPSVAVAQTGAGSCGLSNSTNWFTFSVSLGAWHHYLFEVLSGTAGTAKLTVDGTVVGTFSGDTRDVSLNTYVANVLVIGGTIGPSPPAEFYVDDLSVYSGVVAAGGGGATQARALVLA